MIKLGVNRAVSEWDKLWQNRPGIARMICVLWLLLISGIAFLWNLGNIGLVDETEPLFAEAARQMTVTGDWITPYFNGETRFDKPPLIYWLMAIAYKIIGVNEWSARLPSAMAGIALTCLGFYTLQRYGISHPWQKTTDSNSEDLPETTKNQPKKYWISAFIGSALIALNPETIAWGRIGVSDMLLTGCMCSALLAFFLGYADTEKRKQEDKKVSTSPWYWAFYVLSALAILAKGPVGIVLPSLIIGAFLIYLGKFWEVLQEMQPVKGILLLLAISIPWYVLVILANGESYIDSFFGYHNLERFTSVVNHHWAPWYFYFIVLFLGFAPWSMYLPVAVARLQVWKRAIWRRQPRSSHLGLFAFFWFAGIFSFFTIAVTKLPSYILPLMPACAIIVALFFSGQIEQELDPEIANNSPLIKPNKDSKFLAGSGWVNVSFWLILAAALFSSYRWLQLLKDPAMPNFTQAVQQSGYPLLGGLIVTATAIGCIWLLLNHQMRWLWSVNLLGFALLVIVAVMPVGFLLDQHRQLPLRQIAHTVIQTKQPGEELVMLGFSKPSLVFYTQKPVRFFAKMRTVRKRLKIMMESQTKPTSVLIVATPDKFKEAGLAANQYQILKQATPYQLVRISQQTIAKKALP